MIIFATKYQCNSNKKHKLQGKDVLLAVVPVGQEVGSARFTGEVGRSARLAMSARSRNGDGGSSGARGVVALAPGCRRAAGRAGASE